MTHSDKLMLDKAMGYVEHIGSVRRKAKEMGLDPGTLQRWLDQGDEPKIRGINRDRLRAFVARQDALRGIREGPGGQGTPGASQGPSRQRIELIGLLADPDVSDEAVAAAMVRYASEVLGKRP